MPKISASAASQSSGKKPGDHLYHSRKKRDHAKNSYRVNDHDLWRITIQVIRHKRHFLTAPGRTHQHTGHPVKPGKSVEQLSHEIGIERCPDKHNKNRYDQLREH